MTLKIIERLECEQSLHAFFEAAWPYMEGGNPFIDNWHIQAICEHLEAVYRRDIRRLLINVPPRTGKSSLVSCAFPAWVWIHNTQEKFLFASYAASLSLEHSIKCRRLIESPWYQELWPHVSLANDQNAKGYFQNIHGGYRISTSVGGSVTGAGGSILVCFPFETLIQTNKGELQIGKIVEEKIDCKILSYNHKKETIELQPIEKYEKNESFEMLEIEYEDGTILECTPCHPIFVEEKGYIRADQLTEDDCCFLLR